MSTRRETKEDRATEKEIITSWCDIFGYSWEKIEGEYAAVDFKIIDTDGSLAAVAEVKDYRSWKEEYSSIFLDVGKAIALRAWHDWGIIAFYIVRTPGPILWQLRVKEHEGKWPVVVTGRKDRNTPDDIRPAYQIPKGEFKILR